MTLSDPANTGTCDEGTKLEIKRLVRNKRKQGSNKRGEACSVSKMPPHHNTPCRVDPARQTAGQCQNNPCPSNAQTETQKINTTAREGQSKQPFLCESLSLPVLPPLSTFKIFSHINTVVGKRLACDSADKNGAVGTFFGFFTQWSCLKHSALHTLLKVHALKLCPTQLPGKGARQHLEAVFVCERGCFR